MACAARVLIVDDSRTFRAGLEEALGNEPGIVVAGSVFNGERALVSIRTQPPDVVTLDVDMPGLDGLQVLQAIQEINRQLPAAEEIGVLMVSAFTRRGVEITVRALQAGAFDFVTKPSSGSAEESIARLRRDIVPRIRLFLARRARTRTPSSSAPVSQEKSPATGLSVKYPGVPVRTIRAVVIGCSTGGPKALAALLPDLRATLEVPIVVVQHMPAAFTSSLAESLARQTGLSVVEAREGMRIEPQRVYIAPGGCHMVLRRDAQGTLVAGTNDQPPECGCRPSASVLFRSAAAVLGHSAVALVLTGMGNDGTTGLAAFKRAGGFVIAQDEATSVVWGMPGSAVAAGYVDAVAPLGDIGSLLRSLAGKGNPA